MRRHIGPPSDIRVHEQPLLRVRLDVAETGFMLPDGERQRSVHRFLGGRFGFGGRLSGTVLPGGGDKALRRADGTIEIDAYAVLRTDDGVNILLSYAGVWRAKPGAIE